MFQRQNMNTIGNMEKELVSEERIEDAKKGMLAHAIVYVCVSALLTAINLLLVKDVVWFVYPVIGMGIGVTMHYLFGIVLFSRKAREGISQ
jgi:hypothetical protein